MKLNWGGSIALFYMTFMAVLLFFVIKSTTYNNSLVLENYYEQDLKYQAHFDKKKNNASLERGVEVNFDKDLQVIKIYFPKVKAVKGILVLFHPENDRFDLERKIELNEKNEMIIPSKNLLPGRWKIKLDWSDTVQAYYTEKEIII